MVSQGSLKGVWSFKCVIRKFQGCFKKVSRMFQESLKDISRKFQGSFNGVLGSFQVVLRQFKKKFVVERRFNEVLRLVQGIFMCISRKFKWIFKRFNKEEELLIVKSPRLCLSFFLSFCHSVIPLKFTSTVLYNSVRHAPACQNAIWGKWSNYWTLK